MGILVTNNLGILEYPTTHDPVDEKYYTFYLRPRVRENSKEYYKDDVVILSPSNGHYYVCIDPGVSAASIPVFNENLKTITEDGTVKWKSFAYTLIARTGDRIATAAEIDVSETIPPVTWTCPNCDILDTGNNTTELWAKVVPKADVKEFTLTGTFYIQRTDSRLEKFEQSIKVTVTDN